MAFAPYQIVVLWMIAIGVQFALLGCSLMLEFSDRKRYPRPLVTPERRPRGPAPAARPSAQRPSAPARVTPIARPPAPPPAPTQAPATTPAGAEVPEQARPEPVPEPAPEPAAPSAETPEEAPEARAQPAEPAPVETPPRPPAEPVAAPASQAAEAATPEKAVVPVRIGAGLRRTREGFLARLRAAISGSSRLDEVYEGLEEALIAADVGVDASMKIVQAVRDALPNDARPDAVRTALKAEIERILTAAARPMVEPAEGEPLVMMLAGVNGAGKTTTIAKLAAMFRAERGPVTVAAADTFRAAAIDQLEVWCKRVGADIIKQKQGSDPAAVAFDAVAAARARQAKVVLIDTAGRLQTKVNLMEELKKIARVIGRELSGAPHETWLVLDATTGQNALSQAKLFGEAVALSGVVLTKLDSTAKGGVIIGIAEQLKLPVRYVGLGENLEDLRGFDPHEFVEALFEDEDPARESASGSYAA